MKKLLKSMRTLFVAAPIFAMSLFVGGCSSSSDLPLFIIYNAAGAAEFHHDVVVEEFRRLYGDRFQIMYQTLSAPDVVAQISAQGLAPGNGNVNIVIMGDSDVARGIPLGVFTPLNAHRDALRVNDLVPQAQANFNRLGTYALPMFVEIGHSGIVFMPGTEVGGRLNELVTISEFGDAIITYEEFRNFMLTDPGNPIMGRGRLTFTGPGDAWSWGLLQHMGEYGRTPVQAPTRSIDWVRPLYQDGRTMLFPGSGATFTALVEGTVDVIPHTPAWYFRLHALGLARNTLPTHLQIDSFGLEDSRFALITGENVNPILASHFYMIPSNLSPEAFEASMAFMQMAIRPEINSQSYVSLMMPSYTTSSLAYIEDPDVLLVWNEVAQHFPQRFLTQRDGLTQLSIPEGMDYVFMISEPYRLYVYGSAWARELEEN